MAHGPCLYDKAFICQRLSSLFSHNYTMRPKVQLTPLDVNCQQEEQAKTRARLDELKKPKVIPQEKPLANFSFKPGTFDLPSSTPSTSKDSPLGFGKFIGRNLFYLRTKPSIFSSSSSSSNPSLVENPCYGCCSLLSTPPELKPSRSSPVLSLAPPNMTLRPLSGSLKSSPIVELIVTTLTAVNDNGTAQTVASVVPLQPDITTSFDFFGRLPQPELISCIGE